MRNRNVWVVCLAACIVLAAPFARGATIRVTTTDFAGSPSECSLAGAILNANADAVVDQGCVAGTGRDVIVLERGETYRVSGVRGLYASVGLEIAGGSVTIEGNGATIEPAESLRWSRAFVVQPGAELQLNNVTLQGFEVDSEDDFGGGAILNLGGFVWLNRCTVTENRAPVGGGLHNLSGYMVLVGTNVTSNIATAGVGGGIANEAASGDADLVVMWSRIAGNQAVSGAGQTYGGGIASMAELTYSASVQLLQNTEVIDNYVEEGVGGGFAQETLSSAAAAKVSVVVQQSDISHNRADWSGGGIYSSGLFSQGSDAVVTLRDSTVANNQAQAGGGLDLLGSTALFMASTVADNEAQHGQGGGIRVAKGVDSQPSHLEMRRSTVSGNSARGGVETAGSGGGIVIEDSTALFEASTISGNFALGRYGSGGSPDYHGGEPRKAVEGIGGGIAVTSGGETVHDTWLYMVSCTVAENTSTSTGGAVALYRHNGSATVEAVFRNTLMAYNREQGGVSPGTCANASADRYGHDDWPKGEALDRVRFQSEGHNMADEASCEFDQATDMVVEDAMLSGLEKYDEDMHLRVHTPQVGSPAIDAGRSGVNYDQRGYPRNVDGDGNGSCVCDCGAVEAFSKPRQHTVIPIPGEDQWPPGRVPPPGGSGSGSG